MKKMMRCLAVLLAAFFTIWMYGEDNKLGDVKSKSNIERYCDQALKSDQSERLKNITDAMDKALAYSLAYNTDQHSEDPLLPNSAYDIIKDALASINKIMKERYLPENTPSKTDLTCEFCHLEAANPIALSFHVYIIHHLLKR